MRIPILLTAVLAAGLFPHAARAQIILQDDFNDNSLDPSKWYTAQPFGDSSTLETGQRIELRNRGYLITQNQFDPTNGGLRIQGQFTFTNATFPGHDNFQIVTRTNGIHGGGSGELLNGISFLLIGNDAIGIDNRTTGTVLGIAPLTINNGERFEFDVRDNGIDLFFHVQKIGGDGAAATLMATSNTLSAINRIAFYNREFNNGTSTLGYLDDVIVTVPEPGGFLLAGVAATGWIVRRRRAAQK